MVLMAVFASTLLAFAFPLSRRCRASGGVLTPLHPDGFLLLVLDPEQLWRRWRQHDIPHPSSGGTPAGTYAVTIAGTSNGVSHSQTLTLTVN